MKLSTYFYIVFLVLASCKKEKIKISNDSNPKKMEEITAVTKEIDTTEKKVIEEKSKIKKTQKITLRESNIPIKKPSTPKEKKAIKEMKDTAVKQEQIIINTEKSQVEVIKEEVVEEEKVVKLEKLKLTPEIIKVNTADFRSRINEKEVQLIDVRTPKEYKDSHIVSAKNINIYDNDFVQQANALDKSKPVYVYCRSGVRSMKAAKKLKNAGYQVYNLNDGIKGWKKEGNKTE